MDRIEKKKRVLVAMSGGVDSSVAAALLKEQGYDVIGVTMQVWDYSANQCSIEEGNGTCCSSIDVEDARSVADHLEIPFYVLNCEEPFKEKVIDNFVENYLKGQTPVPCVHCNTYLKFDYLYDKMKELDCDYLATGHYAQTLKTEGGKTQIVSSYDDWKDQTFFLFTLRQEILDRLLFPVGDWKKPELRLYAEEKGLPVAAKKDSTGICFIGKNDYGPFVEQRAKPEDLKPGQLKLYPDGEILGDHQGIHRFTYGQRKGLGVSYKYPLYVIKIDAQSGDVWLGEEQHLYGKTMTVKDINWLDQPGDEKLTVKIRFAHSGALAHLKAKAINECEVEFDEPQRAITPGQAAVFYRGNQLVGGGWICQR
ncbi:MAG: tRNA 2-thiouridine(34) synthase MnmA [Bdellovibrionales bacterium]|nr:tRNA 2-thiouridine(34) synthase MnmA [Bdellovibrionales bacterium]